MVMAELVEIVSGMASSVGESRLYSRSGKVVNRSQLCTQAVRVAFENVLEQGRAAIPFNRRGYRAEYQRTSLLRAHGPYGPGDGVRASQSDGPVLLDLPDGEVLDMVPLRRDRHSGLRALSRRYYRNVALRHGAGAVGDAGRDLSRRARGA